MRLKKPNFWDLKKPNVFAILLKPLSKIYELIIKIKRRNGESFRGIKTICIGNIYIGGTGKTSLAIKIKEILNSKNVKSCFVKKYHKNQIDEQKLLSKYGKVFISNTRKQALEKAILEKYEFAIFDDGLQDQSIKYDFSFICFNSLNGFGNGLTIPAGPLRENINNLINYHNVFLNGNGEQTNHIKDQMKMINPNLNIIETKYISVNNKHLDKNEDYLVFSGIGNHGTFINMLKNEDYNVIEDIEFPDHYNYTKKDLQNIFSIADKKKLKILTTEKDYLRIGPINLNKIHCIESALELTKEEKLIDILKINNETN